MQQNWKVKWHRLAANAPSSDGFLIDLFNNTMHEPVAARAPAFSLVRVDHDSSGMLSVNLPKSSGRSFRFGFLPSHSRVGPEGYEKMSLDTDKQSLSEAKKDSQSDDDRIRETHTVLCNVHRAIFYEQVGAY